MNDWRAANSLDAGAVERLLRQRDEALEQRDRARALACRLEEELALIRRAAHARRHG